MLVLLAGAGLACVLGLALPPIEARHTSLHQEGLDVVRVGLTTCLAVTLVLGPGIAARVFLNRPIRLAFAPLFGIGVMTFAGCLAWCLHGSFATETTCFAVVGPVLGLMFGVLLAVGREDLLTPEERRTLLLVGIPVGLAIARSLWSLGPIGELDAGQIGHNLVT